MRIRRGHLTDLYVEGERSVAMVGESVMVLAEIATTIVSAVPEVGTTTLDEIVATVIGLFGEPEPPASAADLTLQQVHDLAAHGVLVIEDNELRGPPDSYGRDDNLPHAHAGPAILGDDNGTAAVGAVRDALRHVRGDSSAVWSLPSDVLGAAFVAAAHQHHVVPYLAAGSNHLALPPQASSELKVAAGRQHAGAVILAAELTRALDVLNATGIKALVFKGVALASQAYGDFSARGAGDLDLLVSPTDLESAYAALVGAGWLPGPDYPSPGPSWAWRHFVRTGNEVPLTAPESMIDLHWHLAPTRGIFPAFATLWGRRVAVNVDGREVPTLAPYDALAHSAGHAARDQWRWLRSLLDVHQLAARRDTWELADRPLHGDQLLTLGLAARIFGRTRGMPDVVAAAVELTDEVWEFALAEQVGTAPTHRPLKVPGHNLLRNLLTTSRSGGATGEALRLLGRSALPPWLTAQEVSPHATAAVPRVLTLRARELLLKAWAAPRD